MPWTNSVGADSADGRFVHGTDDPLLPASWSERAADRTGGDLEPFEGCGHWPARERRSGSTGWSGRSSRSNRGRPATVAQFRSVSTATNAG